MKNETTLKCLTCGCRQRYTRLDAMIDAAAQTAAYADAGRARFNLFTGGVTPLVVPPDFSVFTESADE
jgi:hypothetical protein